MVRPGNVPAPCRREDERITANTVRNPATLFAEDHSRNLPDEFFRLVVAKLQYIRHYFVNSEIEHVSSVLGKTVNKIGDMEFHLLQGRQILAVSWMQCVDQSKEPNLLSLFR